MSEIKDRLANIIVIKRDGKKDEFNGSKIAVAIKKGFDSIKKENTEEEKYTEKDIYKVYIVYEYESKTGIISNEQKSHNIGENYFLHEFEIQYSFLILQFHKVLYKFEF